MLQVNTVLTFPFFFIYFLCYVLYMGHKLVSSALLPSKPLTRELVKRQDNPPAFQAGSRIKQLLAADAAPGPIFSRPPGPRVLVNIPHGHSLTGAGAADKGAQRPFRPIFGLLGQCFWAFRPVFGRQINTVLRVTPSHLTCSRRKLLHMAKCVKSTLYI